MRTKSKTSTPFLSGDAFKELADYSISNRYDLELLPKSRIDGPLVFCHSDLLEEFTHKAVEQLSNVCLIVGNADRDFFSLESNASQLTRKVFLQNSFISDNEKIFTLPIGIENLQIGINGLPKNLVASIEATNKSSNILVGPFSPTHASRTTFLHDWNSKDSCFTIRDTFISPANYAALVGSHKYVLCPRGNGVDTHRFWESLYRGSVPIVKRSNWSLSLRIHGFPFIEVTDFTQDEVKHKVREVEDSGIYQNFNPKELPSLWIDYWKEMFLR